MHRSGRFALKPLNKKERYGIRGSAGGKDVCLQSWKGRMKN